MMDCLDTLTFKVVSGMQTQDWNVGGLDLAKNKGTSFFMTFS
jgi:hypothetical protein